MNTQTSARLHWIAIMALLVVTFVWGATFTLTKGALARVPVFPFLSIRFCLASLVLIGMTVASARARQSFDWRTLWLGSLLGFLLFGAYAFQTLGLQYTTPSAAGFLTGLSVVLVPILGLPLLRNKPHPRNWYGAGLAVIGLAFLCGVDLLHLAVGDLLVLLCAFFIAGQMILIEKYGRETDSLALATVEIVALTILSLSISLTRPDDFPSLTAWFDRDVWWAVFICAVPGTALAYWAQNVFQKYTSSAQTALIFSMEPVFAALVAWWVLGEVLGPVAFVGCVLIFLSMLVADTNFRFARN